MAFLWITVDLNHPNSAAGEPVLEVVERQAILQALEICEGNITKAAACLGIYRTTLQRKIRRHRIGEEPQKGTKGR